MHCLTAIVHVKMEKIINELVILKFTLSEFINIDKVLNIRKERT